MLSCNLARKTEVINNRCEFLSGLGVKFHLHNSDPLNSPLLALDRGRNNVENYPAMFKSIPCDSPLAFQDL